MKNRVLSVTPYQVGATYIGTAMGAGFATGQEVLQFFCYFGPVGTWGVALATLLLGVFGYAVMELGRRSGALSYRDVLNRSMGGLAGRAVDYLITFFMFGGLVSMVAGSGALMSEQLGWQPFAGAILMTVASAVTVLLGLRGIVDSMAFLVPLMFAAMVVFGVVSGLRTGYFLRPEVWRSPSSAVIPSWPLSAVVYASYNIVLTVAVLSPFGAALASREDAIRGATVGGAGLGAAAVATFVSVSSHLPAAAAYGVPMLFVAGAIHPLARALYAVVVLAAIYTTAISALYGFVSRLTTPESPRGRRAAVLTSTAAVALASVGFTNVVRFLYPSVGIAGLLLMAGLARFLLRS